MMRGRQLVCSTPARFVRAVTPGVNRFDARFLNMLRLDGAPLLKPRLTRVNWELHQEFEECDDPDRTGPEYDWQLPGFIEAVDPVVRSGQTTAEEYDVSEVRGFVPGYSFARAVHGVLQEAECAEVLGSLNAKGFTPALVNVGHGMQQYLPEYRDGYRVIQDSPPFADWLLEALRPHLPASMTGSMSGWGVSEELTLSEVNERCRFLCYLPGNQFKPHKDGGQMRPPRLNSVSPSSTARNLSLITMQLYLHDMPEEYGGATKFRLPTAVEQLGREVSFQPRAGSALLFTHELTHEGAVVNAGSCGAGRKFTMRTDVMYAGHHLKHSD